MNEIIIGKNVWMDSNLDVDTFRNGDPISHAQTDQEWKEAGKSQLPAWRWPSSDVEENKIFGKLYNHFAVTDPRGLAPEGYIIPKKNDLKELLNGKLLTDKINLSKAGLADGTIKNVGRFGYYWSDSTYGNDAYSLSFSSALASISLCGGRDAGLSVRCIKKI